jgi:hypothetical protein
MYFEVKLWRDRPKSTGRIRQLALKMLRKLQSTLEGSLLFRVDVNPEIHAGYQHYFCPPIVDERRALLVHGFAINVQVAGLDGWPVERCLDCGEAH